MSKITKSAKGKPCQLRLDGCVSGGQNETTIWAHIGGGGMGRKMNDIHGFYCCFECHELYDARKPSDYEREWLDFLGYKAMVRSQEILLKEENVRCY
jgi:hypothetical protein